MRPSQAGTRSEKGTPEGLLPPHFEVLERHALLLDPGEVSEVENPAPVVVGALEEVVVGGAEDVLAEHLGGGRLVKTVRPVTLERLLELASVEGRTVR